jgi:hypothetical protein
VRHWENRPAAIPAVSLMATGTKSNSVGEDQCSVVYGAGHLLRWLTSPVMYANKRTHLLSWIDDPLMFWGADPAEFCNSLICLHAPWRQGPARSYCSRPPRASNSYPELLFLQIKLQHTPLTRHETASTQTVGTKWRDV